MAADTSLAPEVAEALATMGAFRVDGWSGFPITEDPRTVAAAIALITRELERLARVEAALQEALAQHYKTGDYRALGIAAQDALAQQEEER